MLIKIKYRLINRKIRNKVIQIDKKIKKMKFKINNNLKTYKLSKIKKFHLKRKVLNKKQ